MRLYQRMNDERAKHGEKLLRIPQELLAYAAEQAQVANDIAQQAATAGIHTADDISKKSASIIGGGLGKAMQEVSKTMADLAEDGVNLMHDMASDSTGLLHGAEKEDKDSESETNLDESKDV